MQSVCWFLMLFFISDWHDFPLGKTRSVEPAVHSHDSPLGSVQTVLTRPLPSAVGWIKFRPSCAVFSYGPMRNVGFLGRWGMHACPQCLPSDTVPVRSWTRTLRRPGPEQVTRVLLPLPHDCVADSLGDWFVPDDPLHGGALGS